jgi:hypothetical protein
MAIISIPNSIGGVSIPGNLLKGPLASLYSNKNNIDILKYPRDLESATRGHVVQFLVNEITPIGYQEGKEYSLTTAVIGVGNAIGNAVTSAKDSLAAALPSSVSKYLGTGKVGDGNTKFNLDLEPSKKKTKAIISLYMPDNLNFSYTAKYGEVNLTDVAKNTLEKLPGMDSKSGKLITGALESDATKLLIKSQGLAINPNQQLLFDGLDLRTYSLTFTFTPYSQQEAETVRKIIQSFKTYSRPRTVAGAGGMLFIPPSTFNLKFLFNGAENTKISKVEESVITDIDVNYTPNGFAAHSDGAPVQTTMTIQFKEIILIDSDKVQAGY